MLLLKLAEEGSNGRSNCPLWVWKKKLRTGKICIALRRERQAAFIIVVCSRKGTDRWVREKRKIGGRRVQGIPWQRN